MIQTPQGVTSFFLSLVVSIAGAQASKHPSAEDRPTLHIISGLLARPATGGLWMPLALAGARMPVREMVESLLPASFTLHVHWSHLCPGAVE